MRRLLARFGLAVGGIAGALALMELAVRVTGLGLPPETGSPPATEPLPPEPTISKVFGALNIPPERCHLVLVNGNFVPPSQRASHALQDGDTLAAWPPVAGG